jgi:hypothetical protein
MHDYSKKIKSEYDKVWDKEKTYLKKDNFKIKVHHYEINIPGNKGRNRRTKP